MQLDQIYKVLRGVKLRPTRQRIALARILFNDLGQHVTAEMLFAKAKSIKLPISLGTVYNTLHQFSDAGLLSKVNTNGSRIYFDTNTTPHHHFVTEQTGELFDIPQDSISVSCLQEAPAGTEIERVDVIVHIKKLDEVSTIKASASESVPVASSLASVSLVRSDF